MAMRKKGRGGAREGAGRKPLPPQQKQRNRIMVSFTDAELDAITNAARGQPVATFLHDLAVRFAPGAHGHRSKR